MVPGKAIQEINHLILEVVSEFMKLISRSWKFPTSFGAMMSHLAIFYVLAR